MIQFADLFHLALPFVIVIQPTLDRLALLGANTELAIAPSRVGHGQDPDLVALSCLTARATLAMKDGALEQ